VIPSVYLDRLFAAHVQIVPHYYIPLPLTDYPKEVGCVSPHFGVQQSPLT
jgi:hypothetical protein